MALLQNDVVGVALLSRRLLQGYGGGYSGSWAVVFSRRWWEEDSTEYNPYSRDERVSFAVSLLRKLVNYSNIITLGSFKGPFRGIALPRHYRSDIRRAASLVLRDLPHVVRSFREDFALKSVH